MMPSRAEPIQQLARVMARAMIASLALICAWLAPLAAGAQQTPDIRPGRGGPRVAVLADFGFVGNVVAHRWTPIFVTVDPGPRGLTGMVEIEFTQDESQRARISVPFAAAADTPTRVLAVAAFPLEVPRVLVRVLDDSGRVRASTTYSKLASDTAAQLPPILPPETAMVVAVGRSSVLAAGRVWRTGSAAADRWTAIPVVPSLDLPTEPIAYDGVAAMVATAEAARTTDPRAIEAIHEWVRAGGRLIVLADGPGAGWSAWLPPEVRGTILVGESRRLDVPPALREALSTPRLTNPVEPEDGSSAKRTLSPPQHRAADAVRARPVSLRPSTPAAELLWPLEEGGQGGEALAASVPAGFGTVMVLGVDPAEATLTRSPEHATTAWQQAIAHLLDDITQWGDRRGLDQRSWDAINDPGSQHMRAVTSLAASLSGAPQLRREYFWALGAVMVALVLLVGPIDAIVLRRLRLRHRSWATALLWIALASAAAFILPQQMRGSETSLRRFATIDAFVAPQGQPIGAGPAFQTGITGVFAGGSGAVPIQSPTPRAFFRGASTTEWTWWPERTSEPAALLPVIQAATGGADGSWKGGRVPSMPMAMWTYRALLDQGPARVALWAEVRGAATDEPTVRIGGLPEAASVGWVRVRIGDRVWVLTGERRADGVWQAVASASLLVRGTERDFIRPESTGDWPSAFLHPVAPGDAPIAAGSVLPGPDRRRRGIDRLVASGKYAAIWAQVVRWPPEITGPPRAQARQAVLLRLLTPLDATEPMP